MGIVTVPKFAFPPQWQEVAGSASPVTLDAADKRIAHIFAITKNGTLDKFEFLTGPTVAVNAASVIRVSFRGIVAATGEPSGVNDQRRNILGSALSANTWISPGVITDDGSGGGVKRVVTRGDLLAIHIEYTSFTGGDDLDIAVLGGRFLTGKSGSCDGFPYDLFQSGGSWDRSPAPSGSGPIAFALKYADGTYTRPIAPGQFGVTTIGSNPIFDSADTPDERGNIFTLTVPIRVTGANVAVAASPGDAYEVVLIDTDGSTELEAVTVDGDHATNLGPQPRFVPFDASHELAIGTYRLTIRPTTGNVAVANIIVDDNAVLESVFNKNWFGTSRADAGAWTEEDTRFYFLNLVVDGLEEGSGAAGGGGGAVLSDRGFVRGMVS